nr:MAG: hypothetical protein [Bacteriophage sp.]
MKILVYSRNQLNEIEKNKIKGIFKESKCPNESLKNTFNRFAFMQGNNTVYFDDITVQNRHKAIVTEIEI